MRIKGGDVMADLDPQVQVRLIGFVEKWFEVSRMTAQTPESFLKKITDKFDEVYKAVAKTVKEA